MVTTYPLGSVTETAGIGLRAVKRGQQRRLVCLGQAGEGSDDGVRRTRRVCRLKGDRFQIGAEAVRPRPVDVVDAERMLGHLRQWFRPHTPFTLGRLRVLQAAPAHAAHDQAVLRLIDHGLGLAVVRPGVGSWGVIAQRGHPQPGDEHAGHTDGRDLEDPYGLCHAAPDLTLVGEP
jgi:hypothetical protein